MPPKKPTKSETELLMMLDKLRNWYWSGMKNEYYDHDRGDAVWEDAAKLLGKWGVR